MCVHMFVFLCVYVVKGFLGPRSLAVEKHHGTFGGLSTRPIFEPAESIEPFTEDICTCTGHFLHYTEFQKAHRAFKTHLLAPQTRG